VSAVREVATPHGPARLHTDRSRRPAATLVLGHGAGGGVGSRDLVALARGLPRSGISVVRVEQPWRVAGRKLAPAPKVLDECFVAAVDQLRPRTPLVVGGRSAGARSAARTAAHLGASGVLAVSFPLHPPGRPERTRADELLGVDVPLLVVQGERDSMGAPEEFPEHLQMTVLPDADHGLKVPARGELSQEDVMAVLVEATMEFVMREVVGNPVDHRRVAP
jgi:uncharacterized protein